MKKLLFILLFPIIAFGQDIPSCKGNCVNGQGVLTTKLNQNITLISDGQWKDNYLISGSCKKIFYDDITYKRITIIKKGAFDENIKLKGQGSIIYFEDVLLRREQIGYFNKDKLVNGKEIINDYCNIKTHDREGVFITEFEYENSELINTKYNYLNNYDKDDINIIYNHKKSKKTQSVKITLSTDKDYIKCWIPLTTTNGDIFQNWDTGAWNWSITTEDSSKLVDAGIEFTNLNLTMSSSGIAGIPITGNLYKINNIKIGQNPTMIINNIVVEVCKDQVTTLMGMDFFRKFSNIIWDKENKTLEFFK